MQASIQVMGLNASQSWTKILQCKIFPWPHIFSSSQNISSIIKTLSIQRLKHPFTISSILNCLKPITWIDSLNRNMFQPLWIIQQSFNKHHIIYITIWQWILIAWINFKSIFSNKKKQIETDLSLIFIRPILRHCTTFSFHRQDESHGIQ